MRVSRVAMRVPFLLVALSLAAMPSPIRAGSSEELEFTRLLDRLNGVADLYRDAALQFTCKETIRVSRPGFEDEVFRFAYIYTYLPEKGLTDYRTEGVSRRRAKQSSRPVQIEDYGIPYLLERAYSWAFIFERAKRDMYRYWFAGEDKALGQPAIKVEFEPVPPLKEDLNDWVGTAWIDRDTSQLLRVEALKADQQAEAARLEADLLHRNGKGADDSTYDIRRIVTEFSVEKNGMRFPGKVLTTHSRYRIVRRRDRQWPVETEVYQVTQTYQRYRFFGVRTRDEIREIVGRGDGHQGYN